MKDLEFTRRGFGMSVLAASFLGQTGMSIASTDGFQNPELLMHPEEILGRLNQINSRPAYEKDGTVLIDVRPQEEFSEGHIPGARHLAPNAVAATEGPVDGALKSFDKIEQMLGDLGISPEKRVVFYDDRGGFHAARMFWLLEYLGHRNVAVLNGGWSGWLAAGGPQSTSELEHTKASFEAAPSPRRFASADYILAHENDAETVIIDVRPTKLYDKGHIPWAKSIPWSRNLKEDKTFKTAGDLLQHFESHGVTSDHNVVLHCQNGLASAHSYVALRLLGFPRVRVYHRSWAEWGNDASLPKAIS
ncbi:MAG: rhodanese-like domain-containing protein [Pseudomonadota bacterium]